MGRFNSNCIQGSLAEKVKKFFKSYQESKSQALLFPELHPGEDSNDVVF